MHRHRLAAVSAIRSGHGIAVTVELPEDALSLDITDSEAVIAVRGPLDETALVELIRLFDTALATGCTSFVLDLVAVDSVAPTGPAVIGLVAQRFTGRERRLAIRSPSTVISSRLVAQGLGHLLLDEEFELTPRRTEQPSTFVDLVPDDNADAGRDSAVPTESDLIDAALRLVVELARSTVKGADGVSVSLRRHGRLATVAASDQTILEMDAEQYSTGEGPCVDASIEGRRFLTESLDDEQRWPTFTPKARALGIRAILSSPLVAHTRPVGALNIYSLQPDAFGSDDQSLAMRFATEVSAILTDAGMDVSDDRRSEQFQASLRSREVIAQAQGVIMGREHITEDEAYTILRSHSQGTNISLRECAEEVTRSTRPGAPALEPDGGGGGRRG
jgi:ANTAR domain/GAF domain